MENNVQKFKKVKPVSMVDQVSEDIKAQIASGAIKPGDRLPSEAELAASYGVNRLTVRMALQKLSVLGFVETRVGEGSFVTEFNLENVIKEIPPSLFLSASSSEFLQLRKMLEMESAKAGMTQATPEDIAELLRRCDELEEAISDPYNKDTFPLAVERDYSFHLQLVICSHNRLFIQLYQLLAPFFKACIYSNINLRTEYQMQLENTLGKDTIHRELCDAFVQKNWRLCKSIFNRMIDYAFYQPM